MNKPEQIPMFDLKASLTAKQAGIESVSVNAGEFIEEGLRIIRTYIIGEELTGENIRKRCLECGVAPHHYNAWGALISTAVKRRLLTDTGRTTKASKITSHARRLAIYTRTAR